ncbi:MAG: flagellar motor protein MotB [Polyangiales bacterium]
MNLAHPHDPSETLPFLATEAPRARIGAGVWLGAALLAAVTGAAGYGAFAMHGERDQAKSALAASSAELGSERGKLKHANEQLAELEQANAAQRAQLTELGKKLDDATGELVAANQSMVELVDERGELGAELAEFKQMTRELSRMIDSGRLQVSFRRGRMVVELKAQVLFPSGNADLTPDGKDALKEVARSLRGFKDRHFIVAGHTDNVPVSGPFENNWALSSARAVTVTGALIRAGMRPQQLVAAGYGEYDPVARNTTDAGRQSNRRIEIILEPRLRDVAAKK